MIIGWTLPLRRKTGDHPEEVKKIISKVLRQVKNEFKKYGVEGAECKRIYRIEIGSKGAIHIHLLINEIETDIPMINALKIVNKYWKAYGKVFNTPVYEAGGFQGLAEYFCKEPDASGKAGKKARKIMYPYVPSRNLEKPEKIVKVFKRLLVPAEPKKKENIKKLDCMPGYRIDEESITRTVNPFNGMTYLKYTELRI